MELSDETRDRIDALRRGSAQSVLAAELIAIDLLARPVQAAFQGLVYNIATTNQKLKLAAPLFVRQAAEKLQQQETAQAAIALAHTRNLAMAQVHREAADAAAIIKRLTGADVDLSAFKRIMLDSELDAMRAATAARSIASRFGQLAGSEAAVAGLRGTPASELVKRFDRMAKSDAMKPAIEGNAVTMVFGSFSGAHARAWKDLADDGSGPEELLPEGWTSGMMKVWSAILDRKTCQVCFGLDGTMVPIDKPFPTYGHPPAHVRCRCGEFSLFVPEKLAKKLPGIAIDYGALKDDIRDYMRGSSVKLGEGKRHAAEYVREALAGTSPEALTRRLIDRDYFTKSPKVKPPKPGPILPTPPKVKLPTPPPAPKPKPKPAPKPAAPALKQEHDAAFWAKHYAEKYGEAAPAVAWGRTMHERALDRPLGELAAQARKLAEDGHPIFADGMSIFSARAIERMASKLGPTATLRGSALIASDEHRRAWVSVLSQLEHSRDVRRASFPISAVNPEAAKAKAFFETMLDESVQRPEGYTMHVGSRIKGGNVETIERAYHNGFEKVVCVGKLETHEIFVHEWAHAIEATDKRALNRSFQFHEARTRGEAEKKLAELFPGMGYANRETAKPDDYWHAYQGKTYTLPSWDSVKNDYVQVRHNTEMSSMGFQAMSNRSEILKQDEETTWFMLGQLAGK